MKRAQETFCSSKLAVLGTFQLHYEWIRLQLGMFQEAKSSNLSLIFLTEMNQSAEISEINWTEEFSDRGAGHSARRTEH